jgi:hypothetical protein
MKKIGIILLYCFCLYRCTAPDKKPEAKETKPPLVVKTDKEIVIDTVQYYAKRYVADTASYEPIGTNFLDTSRTAEGQPCGLFVTHSFKAKNKFNALVFQELYIILDLKTHKIHKITKYFEFLEDLPCGKFSKVKVPNLKH